MIDKSTETTKKIILFVFLVCLLITAGFSCWFLMIREPIGDDIAGFYETSISFYLDEMEDSLGDRITSVGQAFNAVKLVYSTWSGRILGYTLACLGGVLPTVVKAVMGSGIMMINSLLVLLIAFGNLKETIKHPVLYMVTYLALYWYRPLCSGEYMWTMISIYEFSLMVCLIFCAYMLINDSVKKNVVIAIILGFLAGISNETSAILTISVLGLDWIYKVATKKEKLSSFFMYGGLFVGSIINILSPGNFNRMKQSHDHEIHDISFLERLKDSIGAHRVMLISGNTVLRIVIIGLMVSTTFFTVRFICMYGKKGIIVILRETYPFIISGLVSIAMWGCMPRTPAYGLSFWIALFYITIGRLVKITFPKENFKFTKAIMYTNIVIGTILIIAFIADNSSWLIKHTQISVRRNELIGEAVLSNKEEVVVPRYTDEALGPMTNQDYLNNQDVYDSETCRTYYGLRVRVSDDLYGIIGE